MTLFEKFKNGDYISYRKGFIEVLPLKVYSDGDVYCVVLNDGWFVENVWFQDCYDEEQFARKSLEYLNSRKV